MRKSLFIVLSVFAILTAACLYGVRAEDAAPAAVAAPDVFDIAFGMINQYLPAKYWQPIWTLLTVAGAVSAFLVWLLKSRLPQDSKALAVILKVGDIAARFGTRFHPVIMLAVLLTVSGCVSDQARADIGNSAQASYNAAASLPPSPQAAAIKVNQVAIGHAVGHDLTVTDMAIVPGVTP